MSVYSRDSAFRSRPGAARARLPGRSYCARLLSSIAKATLIVAGFALIANTARGATALSVSGTPVVTDGNGVDTGSVGTTARWTNAGTVNDIAFDLEIEVISNNGTGDSLSFVTDADDAAVFLDGASGQVVELDYNFYRTGTTTPIVIVPEGLLQDIDSSVDGLTAIETVRVATALIANYTLEGAGTDLTVTTLDNGTPGDTSDDIFEVTSSSDGNPGDTNIAIEFDFEPAASVRLTFQKDTIDSRRFTFDGNSASFFTSRTESPQDVVAPAAPTVNFLSTNDTTPTLNGNAEIHSTVSVTVGGATFERVATSEGSWSLDTGLVTPESGTFSPNTTGAVPNEVVATSTDAAGNSNIDTSGNELIIDALAPVVVISNADVVNLSNESTYSVGGTCTDGDGAVTATIDGATPASLFPQCTAGNWTTGGFDVSLVPDGTNTIVVNASQTDAFGNIGNATTVLVNKDSVPPIVPVVDFLATNDTTPIITGTAGTNALVTVSVAGATYSVTASGSGAWSIDTESAVPDSGTFNPNTTGPNNVTASTSDAAGNVSTDTTQDELIIDLVAPVVTITLADRVSQSNVGNYGASGGCSNGDGDVTVAIAGASPATIATPCSANAWSTAGFDVSAIADGTDVVAVDASQTDVAGNIGNATTVRVDKDTTPPAVPVVDNQTTNDTTPVITGTADTTATLAISVAGADYTVTVNGDGSWSVDTGLINPDTGTFNPNTNGTNDVVAVSTDDFGNSSNDTTVDEIAIDTVAPVVTVTTPLTVTTANVAAYSIGGNCETADGSVTVSIAAGVPPNQDVACGAAAWSATFDVTAVSDGTATVDIMASQTDAAGNTGDASASANKDTLAPDIVIVDNGSNGDDTVNTNESVAVVISGTSTAEDGQLVTVLFDDGVASIATSATVDTGAWLAPAVDISSLSDGLLTMTANVSDINGNPAVPATSIVTLDTGLPALTVDALGTVNTTRPTFSGTTDVVAGTEVTVRDENGDVLCTAPASAATPVNLWSCVPTDAIPEGSYTFTAEVDRGAGNLRVVSFAVAIDLDTDNDGIPDAVEGIGDTDADGTPDALDTDSDNDGIPDADEEANIPPLSGIDSDADGIDDVLDVDATGGQDVDGNGVDDRFEPTDSDGDGIPDYRDRESDGDGIADILEGGADIDGDGLENYRDVDSDNDGMPDAYEDGVAVLLSGTDTDSDGIDDAIDADQPGGVDTNGNGINDSAEPINSDDDALPDFIDVDSDNDRIPDTHEAAGVPALTGNDSDDDSIDNALDVDVTGGVDANGNGFDDAFEPLDTDGDGLRNYRDVDSDSDGLSDLVEGQTSGTDTDGDGLDDTLDVDVTGGIDQDGDGVDDAIGPADFDSDGVPNYLDLDSDNDALRDVVEGGFDDINEDGLTDNGELTDSPPNSDNADGPDFIDLDSNDDGSNDIVGTAGESQDLDRNGQIDPGLVGDADGDGAADVIDGRRDAHGTSTDSDGDGVPDPIDLDDDNDGITDAVEAEGGVDVDTDRDGIPDRLDLDSDNDGLSDSVEAVGDNTLDSDRDGVLDDTSDFDGDGLADHVVSSAIPLDTDSDGQFDFRDLDSDGDTLDDLYEGGRNVASTIDTNGDGVVDGNVDADGDGLLDLVDGHVSPFGSDGAVLVPVDTDGDGLTDQLDTDSDNDGLPDISEIGDINNDGIDDSIQDTGPLNTAVSGSGPVGPLMLMLLLAVNLRRRMLTLVVCAMGLSATAMADEHEHSKAFWYSTAGFGLSTVSPEGESNGWRTTDDASEGFKARVGYRFEPGWFAEVSFIDAGTARIENLSPTITDTAAITYKIPAVFAGYTLLDVNRRWNAHVKLGASVISNSSSDARVDFAQQSDVQLAAGLAISWRVTDRWLVLIEHDRYDRDAVFTSLNVGWRFTTREAKREITDFVTDSF